MGKISITDISRKLAESSGLKQQEAEAFVNDFFEAIKQGLETDTQVKVKGLGTFKIVDVEARSSVSVNTGERVVIDSHGKITFTPDTSMKELVNKPFSQFETVVLNEGVTFDDEPEDNNPTEDTSPQTIEQPAEQLEAEDVETVIQPEEVVEEVEEIVEEVEKTPEAQPEEAVNEVEDEAELQAEEAVVDAEEEKEEIEEASPSEADNTPIETEEAEDNEEESVEETEEEPAEEDDEEEDESQSSFWKYVFVGVKIFLIIAIAFAGGYFIGKFISNMEDDGDASDEKNNDKTELVATPSEDSLKVDSLKSIVARNASDSITSQNNTDSIAKNTVPKDTIQDKPDYLKYNEMDERLRTGAYYIMGTKTIHIAYEGESLYRVARRWLGDNERVCYIEIYNGLSRKEKLREGQEVKIPILKTKGYVKRKERAKQKANNN